MKIIHTQEYHQRKLIEMLHRYNYSTSSGSDIQVKYKWYNWNPFATFKFSYFNDTIIKVEILEEHYENFKTFLELFEKKSTLKLEVLII